MLTSADLGELLSPRDATPDEHRRATSIAETVAAGEVLYVGLDSLSDPIVGAAIGSMLTADLDAVANGIYNNDPRSAPVNVFVDEAAEAISNPMIQILNRGRGAGMRLTAAAASGGALRRRCLSERSPAHGEIREQRARSSSKRVVASSFREIVGGNLVPRFRQSCDAAMLAGPATPRPRARTDPAGSVPPLS